MFSYYGLLEHHIHSPPSYPFSLNVYLLVITTGEILLYE